MSEILDATDGADDRQRAAAVARAADLLLAGEVVVLPTDTVYGIAADAFSADATAALLAAKGRDRAIPLPVMVRSPKQLAGLASTVPSAADHLVAAFWPGPLTLVLHAQPRLTWDIGESDGTVAVRMPLDDAALEVITAVGPLAVTTANAPGGDAPRSVGEARDQLGEEVAAYLDGGPRPEGVTSTIVDLTREVPAVLREGAIPTELVLDVAEGRVDPLAAAATLAGDGIDDEQ
jgi:L-threonylcarbamoyladenylate synthase